ncbi:hypothetical protein A4R43_09270 [Amycolatopsis albispora]|uniref:Uncharacterized protein n=1 Tax=Amycolatopsis albispora TaxID=1804986 RepID=A0A344L3S4_9PSEU|nr:hypothetical protein A4R43_09270 [Amycolatopsis albispora]
MLLQVYARRGVGRWFSSTADGRWRVQPTVSHSPMLTSSAWRRMVRRQFARLTDVGEAET